MKNERKPYHYSAVFQEGVFESGKIDVFERVGLFCTSGDSVRVSEKRLSDKDIWSWVMECCESEW